MEYPRYITEKFKPYDPIELTKLTERIVCKLEKEVLLRKYTSFYLAGVYRGIATGCVVGCNLRCFFCWSPLSRDFPESYGKFYSPEDVVRKLTLMVRKSGVRKARLSCGEPTLCKHHLLRILKLIEEEESIDVFILETNGILFGIDEKYVKELTKYSKVYVRVSIKAGFPEKFQWRTGAKGECLELQFKAIENLCKHGISFHVAAMTDPRIMGSNEKVEIIRKIARIDLKLALNLEEEVVDPYETTLYRLRKANVNLKW